ncbi:hypothetical protein [Methylomicrobium lacus]|uniref:hypothetical protein n=1 Tax=Methylomicrobium lacus TaxID=136992 RepID=UPI0035A8D1A4
MTKFAFFKANRGNISKVLLAAALLSGVPFSVCAKPDEVPAEKVQGCQLVGKIEGSSGYGKNRDWQRLAKQSAVKHAGQMGASHVVWEHFYPAGVFNGTVTGTAYRCGT